MAVGAGFGGEHICLPGRVELARIMGQTRPAREVGGAVTKGHGEVGGAIRHVLQVLEEVLAMPALVLGVGVGLRPGLARRHRRWYRTHVIPPLSV